MRERNFFLSIVILMEIVAFFFFFYSEIFPGSLFGDLYLLLSDAPK